MYIHKLYIVRKNHTNSELSQKMHTLGTDLDDAIDAIGSGIRNVMVIGGKVIDVSLDFAAEKLSSVPYIGQTLYFILNTTGDIIAIILGGAGEFVESKIDHFGDTVEDFIHNASYSVELI